MCNCVIAFGNDWNGKLGFVALKPPFRRREVARPIPREAVTEGFLARLGNAAEEDRFAEKPSVSFADSSLLRKGAVNPLDKLQFVARIR